MALPGTVSEKARLAMMNKAVNRKIALKIHGYVKPKQRVARQ